MICSRCIWLSIISFSFNRSIRFIQNMRSFNIHVLLICLFPFASAQFRYDFSSDALSPSDRTSTLANLEEWSSHHQRRQKRSRLWAEQAQRPGERHDRVPLLVQNTLRGPVRFRTTMHPTERRNVWRCPWVLPWTCNRCIRREPTCSPDPSE